MNKIDFRPLFPPVGDQGMRGTCVAFAVTAAHELARHAKINQFEDLSEETLHWKCKQIDGDQQPDTSFPSAFLALEQTGQPHEARWPYGRLGNETDGSYIPPPDAIAPQFCFRAKMKSIPMRADAIKACLEKGHAVALGIPICDSFFVAPNGRVPMPAANQAFVGGHAVLAVGYEEDAAQEKWLIFRNSWGFGWGDQGYGYLLCAYIDVYGGSAAVVVQ